MSDYRFVDPRFQKLIVGHAKLERLWTGGRWTEGPAYFPAGRYLAFSDIPNDRIMRFDETSGVTSILREPAGFANGHTRDRDGRLVSCEHGGRRLSRTEHDGRVITLVDRFEGKRLNSPNDVVVKSDGSIWFTDPTYGIDADYEGHRADSEVGGCYVYRLDSATGSLNAVVRDRVRPNGLCFSRDEATLYVADTGASHFDGHPKSITAYRLGSDGRSVVSSKTFAESDAGFYDGLRTDGAGNIWTSCGGSVRCYDPDGSHLGTIVVPELVSNLCFGGLKRNRLFITAQTSLYAIYLATNGAPPLA